MIDSWYSLCTSFWQSSLWQAILRDSHQAEDTEVFRAGSYAIVIEYRRVGMGMIGAFSLGIEMGKYSLEFIHLAQKHVGERAIFWQLEEYLPQWDIPEWVHMKTYGRNFIEPWTRIIDLSETDEKILENLSQKWRYNIRLAERRGVVTEWVLPTEENIGIWMRLLSETTSRDRFAHNSREYYTSFLRVIQDGNSWGMLFARFDDVVISAGIFVFFDSVGIYYYGASISSELRKHKASYLVQWEAILEAKRRGCTVYDFLGIAPPWDTESSLLGVSEFKEKFGGKGVRVGSKKLFVLSWWRYALFQLFRGFHRTSQKFLERFSTRR